MQHNKAGYNDTSEWHYDRNDTQAKCQMIMTHQNGIMTIMTPSKMSYDNDTCIAQSNNIQHNNTDQNDAHQNDTNNNDNKHNNPV